MPILRPTRAPAVLRPSWTAGLVAFEAGRADGCGSGPTGDIDRQCVTRRRNDETDTSDNAPRTPRKHRSSPMAFRK